MEDLSGAQLGPYRVLAPLGEGGMAAVYKAYQPGLDREVALKILPRQLASDPEFVKRFEQEARLIAKLQHPHILPVIDYGQAEGYSYIVMPFLRAGTLATLLEGKPLPVAEVVRLISQVGEALDYAHAHGVVHRDIKPSNVLLDERSNCLLTDFGIARLVEATAKLTATGTVLGTPSYMSPEQAQGGRVDQRSDIYSLGIILYELATGRVPFRAETPLAVLMKHVQDPLPPPRSLNPAISQALERVILKALAKSPEDRFATAGEMVRALQNPEVLAPAGKAAEVTVAGSGQGPTVVGPAAVATAGEAGKGGRRLAPFVVGCLAILGIAVVGGALIGVFANRGARPTAAVVAGAATSTAHAPPPPTAEPPTAIPLPGVGFKACQVTDTGGIDDKSFNATAWKGVEDAVKQLGVEGKYLESQQQTDYEANINAFLEENCNMIITVGFLLGDATKAGAEANPNTKFSIVDFAYDPTIPNVLGQVFNTNEAAFLAGYAAAATTKTGKIGTFGGIQIPPVTVFMDGYALGAQYYNQKHGTNVEVLGWDPATQTGLFTGNFESTDDGRAMGESLMDEGADIIMPVAGPVGLGTAAAVQERGNAWIVGVDNDWAVVNSDYAPIILTSVLKNMDVTTLEAIKSAVNGTFAGGVTVGTLSNGGVGLAPLASAVPASVKTELDQVKADIISGAIKTSP